MSARDELTRMIACADAHQLAIIEDIARRIAAGKVMKALLPATV